jgi:hypothetical protein
MTQEHVIKKWHGNRNWNYEAAAYSYIDAYVDAFVTKTFSGHSIKPKSVAVAAR